MHLEIGNKIYTFSTCQGSDPADNPEPHSCSLAPAGENATNSLRVKTKDREGSLTGYSHRVETDSAWRNKINVI